jgi:hypothetical protein
VNEHPIRVLSLGAGVQSSTILYLMADGKIPKADHAIFADTGWEPQAVYQHLDKLRDLLEHLKIPFSEVSNGDIRRDTLAGGRFATMPFFTRSKDGTKGMVMRQCTQEYKLQPLMKKQRELAGLKPRQQAKDHRITTIIGISYDEVQRLRTPAFPWIRHEYPLVDLKMTREDCLTYATSKNWATPPRSACIGCPFKSDGEWRLLKLERPDEWQDAVEFDRALRDPATKPSRFKADLFVHRQAVPLQEADLRNNAEKGQLSLFDQECVGMCGV